MGRKTANRAARILALIQAKEEGLLRGVTLQELADILEVGHRSTILRDLRAAEQAQKLAGPLLERLRNRFQNHVAGG